MANERKRKDLFERWVESGEVDNNLAIIQSLSMQGKSMAEIAEVFEISRRTLQNLQKEHPAIEKIDGAGIERRYNCHNLCAESLRRGLLQ